MNKSVIGILAHVDAGKTTLAESIMYTVGKLRKQGRVDHGDTLLDTHELERKRGITIFASRAVLTVGELEITLVDTPGHVDFSSETERTLQVLDYAILVISGTDGVQSHTRTLWKLLSLYNIPTFLFVTKMDFARFTRKEVFNELQTVFGNSCVDFSDVSSVKKSEDVAVLSESAISEFFDNSTISDDTLKEMIMSRKLFPCFFGSGLKNDGVEEFINGMAKYITVKKYPSEFGAKVFKISHDGQGNRLTHMKITGGSLKVRDILKCGDKEEKINSIRIYSGEKFINTELAEAGTICAVTGLSSTENGYGFGIELNSQKPVLEPIMNYRIVLPDGCDLRTFLPKLKLLQEEDPQLHITWNEQLREIHAGLMGEVQMEILKSLIAERFDINVEIDSGRVMYKESIKNTVEGIGHYEPLRHYAEVHLLMEPAPCGAGIVLKSKCDANDLDRNWQRLILTHLAEKNHKGVLTGSPITDIKITLMSGKAHIKHTEGGDFRQAVYRAVRQGLMQAESVILEPYYDFQLDVPNLQTGRAMQDIQMRSGTFEAPDVSEDVTVIKGRIPVTEANGYAMEVSSYTGGRGRFICIYAGYDVCHNPDEVINQQKYIAESDVENTADSVFCTHGSGFVVKWNNVHEYMHLPSCLEKNKNASAYFNAHKIVRIDEDEIEAIMLRTYGPVKRPLYNAPKGNVNAGYTQKRPNTDFSPELVLDKVIVDGYNVIFAWESLKKIAAEDIEAARIALMDLLCNYSAFTKFNTILVFDAYKVHGNGGNSERYHSIEVVYTKEHETADACIEKMLSTKSKKETVRVVTSDALIQLSAVHNGVLQLSALEFEKEILSVNDKIKELLDKTNEKTRSSVAEIISQEE